MVFIKNASELGTTPQRQAVLSLIETAYESIQPQNAMENNFKIEGNTLSIMDKSYNLTDYDRVFLVGFGKGSAGISKIIEEKLGDKLTEGHVIDASPATFSKIHFTKGSHPVPSILNIAFTQALLKRLATLQLTEKDLVLVVICGGGSAMLVAPYHIPIEKQIEVGKALLKSGANITEMNVVRQHLSEVKGGGLAKALFPTRVASLIFSDVPGNNLTYIASGPTAKVPTKIEDAKAILEKYNLTEELALSDNAFTDNPQDDKYFENVSNIIVLSNDTALEAMQKKAQELGITASIYSNKFEGNASDAGGALLQETKPNSIILAGGETTVHVKGAGGKGGRNQEVVLGALPTLPENTIICSFATDGWDNTEYAGAIGDAATKTKAQELSLNIPNFIDSHDSFNFWQQVNDGIDTGRLPSNVSDLFIVYRY